MTPAHEAERIILDLVQPLDPEHDCEWVDLLEASDRILATSVSSPLDFPHWDNSAMDGYAVRFSDVEHCSETQPASLKIVEEIPAGYKPHKTVHPGQAARILTGSMMPAGADTVVIQEVTKREGDRVFIHTPPKLQAFVRRKAEFYQAGEPLLPGGMKISAAAIAVLAAAQCSKILVYRRPRVAILSTGSELVSPDQPLQPGQIVDSNQYALAALVAQTGAEPICLGIIPDDRAKLQAAIAQALQTADIVLSSGGVSVGDYDYVEQILADLGGTLHIRSVAVKPGKPLTVASFAGVRSQEPGARQLRNQRSKSQTDILPPTPNPEFHPNTPPSPEPQTPSSLSPLYFGLPGNPVSALVSYWRFVAPAIRKWSGLASSWGPVWVKGRSRHCLSSDGKRESYLWGQLYLRDGEYEFRLVQGGHSSGNLINLAQINALAVVPTGQTQISVGETVLILQVAPPILELRESL